MLTVHARLICPALRCYSKRQKAEGIRQKGKDLLVKVSVFGESQESPKRLLYIPKIVQSDRSVRLQVHSTQSEVAQKAIAYINLLDTLTQNTLRHLFKLDL